MADIYKVVSQAPVTAPVPGGTFAPSMEVTFETKPSGVVGKVTIPLSHFSTDEVDKAIRHSATVLEAVQKL
jgi:hypothetical protein